MKRVILIACLPLVVMCLMLPKAGFANRPAMSMSVQYQ